jgi:hypothetical protein
MYCTYSRLVAEFPVFSPHPPPRCALSILHLTKWHRQTHLLTQKTLITVYYLPTEETAVCRIRKTPFSANKQKLLFSVSSVSVYIYICIQYVYIYNIYNILSIYIYQYLRRAFQPKQNCLIIQQFLHVRTGC